MAQNKDNKRIAKNTIFLYFRMMLTMVISLYTSRVVLQTLGVDDYGIYQVVGGVVAMLSFINGALSTGSSRFLTFELGTGNFEKLKKTFSSVLTIHIALALIIVLLAETVGLWFVYNKLVIPPDRMDAAVFAYHLSIVTCLFTITQVPYNASIISHERMNIYALMSIVDVSLKLLIVYLLKIGDFDKLKLYALLLCVVQVSIALFYRFYCVKQFKETRYNFTFDKEIFKNILGYSGWNLIANASIALNTQGMTILINMFFNPGVVAAMAISNQVNMAANQFISNFRTAVNPQIVKRYAAEDYQGSKDLLLNSTKYSFFMMLALSLPIVLVAKDLLAIWLDEVPEYSVIFLQFAVVTSLFQVFDTSLYTALYAKGQIKENAVISPILGFLRFPIVYILFKLGYSPVALSIAALCSYALLGLVIKPILVVKIVGYKMSDILSVFAVCFKTAIVGVPIPIMLYIMNVFAESSTLIRFVSMTAVSVICVGLSVYFIGIDKVTRTKALQFALSKLKKTK
ncbi:MAG: oligosaccharide flippase family protein [Rikenellaceae bacterium]